MLAWCWGSDWGLSILVKGSINWATDENLSYSFGFKLLSTAMSGFVVLPHLESVWMSVTCVTLGPQKQCMIQSEGHAEPGSPLAGPRSKRADPNPPELGRDAPPPIHHRRGRTDPDVMGVGDWEVSRIRVYDVEFPKFQ